MTDSARQIASTAPELARTAASAYRRHRRAGAPDHAAWLAVRNLVLDHRPDLCPKQAGEMAGRIIARAAQSRGEWFWKGVAEG